MKSAIWRAIAFATATFANPVAGHAGWDFQIIDYPNCPDTQVGSLNEKGVVAGNGWTETGAFPFTYDSEKKEFTSIPNIPNTTFTGVWAINDLGVLVGFTSFDGNTEVGLILRRHNSYTTLVNPNAFVNINSTIDGKGYTESERRSRTARTICWKSWMGRQ